MGISLSGETIADNRHQSFQSGGTALITYLEALLVVGCLQLESVEFVEVGASTLLAVNIAGAFETDESSYGE